MKVSNDGILDDAKRETYARKKGDSLIEQHNVVHTI